jgi:hypothetical protein
MGVGMGRHMPAAHGPMSSPPPMLADKPAAGYGWALHLSRELVAVTQIRAHTSGRGRDRAVSVPAAAPPAASWPLALPSSAPSPAHWAVFAHAKFASTLLHAVLHAPQRGFMAMTVKSTAAHAHEWLDWFRHLPLPWDRPWPFSLRQPGPGCLPVGFRHGRRQGGAEGLDTVRQMALRPPQTWRCAGSLISTSCTSFARGVDCGPGCPRGQGGQGGCVGG